jgi:hypothetical protein
MDVDTLARWLAILRDGLLIVVLFGLIYIYFEARSVISNFSNPAPVPAQEQCYDPGGGTVCAPGGSQGDSVGGQP